MAKEGCDLNGNGYPYPYVLLTKDGTDLEDEKEYTVVICGFLKGMEDELNQKLKIMLKGIIMHQFTLQKNI